MIFSKERQKAFYYSAIIIRDRSVIRKIFTPYSHNKSYETLCDPKKIFKFIRFVVSMTFAEYYPILVYEFEI